MPFKKLSRRTFLTASSALAFLHTPFARALAQRLAAFSQLDTDELAPVIKRAREKVEHDFNQQVINRELASLLQAL
ncbi:hypothetical protein BW85_18740 [Escherichia coli O69:H11 str. 06-3325]|nr:hypothetical protein BW85_18740 [Escherichia coli O69:H11 str. 06-3325]